MDTELDQIEQQLSSGKRNLESPPLHLWNPELSGDIDIRINAEGEWFHQGDKIQRASLVSLFSKLLRREEDGDYYLVTPAEKWRIQVALHPLTVVDVNSNGVGEGQTLEATMNTGKAVTIDAKHPLSLEPRRENVAVVALEHGLSAIFSRAAWYRLVEMADAKGQIWSKGQAYSLL